MKLKIFLLLIFLSSFIRSFAQQTTTDDLTSLMDSLSNKPKKKELVTNTFNNSHLINQQTTEVVGKNSLDFRIEHRFANLNSGAYNAWGFDGPANIRLGLDYSYDGRLMVGIGRSSLNKMVDSYLKYQILRQKTFSMPISLVLVSSFFYTNEHIPDDNGFAVYPTLYDRFSYCHELIIGRKFSDKFSLQIAPLYLHYNIVPTITDRNDVWAITAAARYKLGKHFALDAETAYTVLHYSNTVYYNESGLGIEIETGGHVFQVFFTNSDGMDENQFIARTTSTWTNWGFKLGFNISRIFVL
ncbi:MAG: DUF5777 family beta-barrel protein [Bacteroidia bacterium]